MLVTLALVYVAGFIIWGRVYFGRRHGVSLGYGLNALFNPGSLGAVLIGIAWPVTLFTHWSPAFCTHKGHVLARADSRASFEADDARYRRTLEEEGRT